MATVVGKNSKGGLKKVAKNSKSSSGSSSSNTSSTQIGLNQSQMNQLKNTSWADKGALASYEKSGSVVGGRNNPNGRGRENVAAIPADSMNPVAPMQLPSIPAPTDPGNVLAPTNIGLQSTAEGMYTVDPATGMMTMAPATDGFEQNQQGRLAEMFKAYEGLGSGEADLAKLEKQNKLAQKRQAVASLTGNLNSIVASSQAEQLKLEGQGRGQTSGFIGGEQARINREAAIAALPVQAQLAAAQGDLAMAEAHVDKLFQIKRQDAQALFNFKAQVINSVYDFADKQEQRRLDEVNKIETRKYQEQQDFLKTQRSLLSSALQQGAPSSVVNAINGATTQEEALIAAGQYNGDVLARQIQQKQLADMYAPSAAGKRDTQVVDGKLIDMQTGEVISNIGTAGNANGTLNGKPQNTTQSQIQGYANRLAEADRIFDNIESQFTAATAFGDKLPNFMQSSERQQFEQAKRNFVNAVLRRESGAVIADSEFANAAKQYFAQPGDSAETLAQKRINRNTVVNNLYREANVPRPVVPGDIIQDEDTGKQYRVEDDGETLTEI